MTRFSFKDPVNWIVFTFTVSTIFIVMGVFWNAQVQTNARISQLEHKLDQLDGGQSNIIERLIRMDERQQTNIKNIEKVLTKLNVQ